jgi:hypothetical protein
MSKSGHPEAQIIAALMQIGAGRTNEDLAASNWDPKRC